MTERTDSDLTSKGKREEIFPPPAAAAAALVLLAGQNWNSKLDYKRLGVEQEDRHCLGPMRPCADKRVCVWGGGVALALCRGCPDSRQQPQV